jgi:phenylacetate-CoA ligase
MNPFHNPVFLSKILKTYLFDINRVWNTTPEKMREYQDKQIRKVVKFAYENVSLYHDTYKKHNIHPSDINGRSDLKKLPFITKNEMKENFPDGIIPKNFNKKYGSKVSTSGSTGKPVSIYYDLFSAIKYVEGFVRILKAYGGKWNKSKILLVIDTKPGTVEHASFQSSVAPFIKKFISLDNIKYLYVGEKTETLIKQIEEFNPEYLGSDPNTLREFAFYRNKNIGLGINPQKIFSSGAMLDSFTRQYIERAFEKQVLDTYGSTEAGPHAFECVNGNGYHVNSDFLYMEFLDENDEDVSYNSPGRLVVTRLYGQGTPIIRYTGVEDILTPIEPVNDCGITTTEMIKSIGGRSIETIRLPNGKTIAPFHITTIPSDVMEEFNTYKIRQFQIIQHRVDDIEVLISIDEKLKNKPPSTEKIIKELKKRYAKKFGPDVNLTVKEVDNIEKDKRLDYVRVVVSKLNKK